MDKTTSAFIAWTAKHDVDVRDREGDALRLEFGVVNDIRKKLREWFELWTSADMPEEQYRMAKVRFEKEIDVGLQSMEKTETKSFASKAWRYLD